jgi:hypothetical protein
MDDGQSCCHTQDSKQQRAAPPPLSERRRRLGGGQCPPLASRPPSPLPGRDRHRADGRFPLVCGRDGTGRRRRESLRGPSGRRDEGDGGSGRRRPAVTRMPGRGGTVPGTWSRPARGSVLCRIPADMGQAVVRRAGRKRAAAGQQLAGVVEEDDPVAQQAPALLRVSGHGVGGVTVGSGRRRAPGNVRACRGAGGSGTGSPCSVSKCGSKHCGPLDSVAH